MPICRRFRFCLVLVDYEKLTPLPPLKQRRPIFSIVFLFERGRVRERGLCPLSYIPPLQPKVPVSLLSCIRLERGRGEVCTLQLNANSYPFCRL